MENLDHETFQRVWQRVNSGAGEMPQLRREPDLQELAGQFRQAARDSHILSRRLRGRHGAMLSRMSRQAWENYRTLQQMLGKRE